MDKSKILDTAKRYIGVKEGTTLHKYIIDMYNSITPLPRGYALSYSSSWCCAFISFLFYVNGCLTLLDGGECGCEALYKKIKDKYSTDISKAEAGSLVFYDWGGDKNYSQHIGIVEERTGNTLTVIEGNASDMVLRRTIDINSNLIRAIVNIKYTEDKKYSVGWNKDERDWWYADTESTYLKDGFYKLDWSGGSDWFYFNTEGYCERADFTTDSNYCIRKK